MMDHFSCQSNACVVECKKLYWCFKCHTLFTHMATFIQIIFSHFYNTSSSSSFNRFLMYELLSLISVQVLRASPNIQSFQFTKLKFNRSIYTNSKERWEVSNKLSKHVSLKCIEISNSVKFKLVYYSIKNLYRQINTQQKYKLTMYIIQLRTVF